MNVGGELIVPLSADKAVRARRGLAKDIYVKLFDWVVPASSTLALVGARHGGPG